MPLLTCAQMFQLAKCDGHQCSQFQEQSLIDGIFTLNSQHLRNISTWCHHLLPHHTVKMPIRVATNYCRQLLNSRDVVVNTWVGLKSSSFQSFVTRCLWNNLHIYGKHTFFFSFAWTIARSLEVVETHVSWKKKAYKNLLGKSFYKN